MTKEEFMEIVGEEGLKGPCAEDFWRLFDKSINIVIAMQAQWIVENDWKSLCSLNIKMETIPEI